MNKFIKDYEHCCNSCKHYDIMNGFCNKHKTNTHSGDNVCSKWQNDNPKPRIKKKKNYEQMTLI